MKNYELTKSVFAALLLVSTSAIAEDKYPASDFQPKVVYQDESAAKSSESASTASASTSSASSSSSDSKYPAANFQPKVVYNDENYKHDGSLPKSSSSSNGSSASVSSAETAVSPAVAQKEDSSVGYLLGLIVFGAAGFFLYKRGSGASASTRSSAPAAARGTGNLTGVGRYIMKASGTGVSRYLDKQAKTAPAVKASVTGVAKYLANQPETSKPAASEAVTGVEKYMRNKG